MSEPKQSNEKIIGKCRYCANEIRAGDKGHSDLCTKFQRAIDALEFVAFGNPDIWKLKDLRLRAKDVLVSLGTHVPTVPQKDGLTIQE